MNYKDKYLVIFSRHIFKDINDNMIMSFFCYLCYIVTKNKQETSAVVLPDLFFLLLKEYIKREIRKEIMGWTCVICHKKGTKGNISFPNDYRRSEWLTISNLNTNGGDVKVENFRICFRHFQSNHLVFVGNQIRATKGK